MIRLAPAVAFIPAAASYALGHGPPSRQAPGRSSVAAIDALDLSKSKVQLSFWHTQTGANQDKLNAIIDTFNASQPSIRVSPEFQGNYDDIYKKLVAAVAAKQAPDVAVSYPSMVSEYQAADAVLPLDAYVASSKYGLGQSERDDFVPPYWKENQYPEYGNALLSFPFTKSLLVMYYNADRVNAAGVIREPRRLDVG
jgi:ABC-type glycerol-3-phosphate transport system substrate-binding protein